MPDHFYRDETVSLPDIVSSGAYAPPVLRSLTFERCTVLGPAVLLMLAGFRISDCSFASESREGVLWPLPQGTGLVGGIRCEDVSFVQCRLENVGLAGGRREIALARASMEPGLRLERRGVHPQV